MTYAELERRANRLARYLSKHGVGPESVAGICLEPSPEMIVAVLAVLKAGGAYLPLDPSYPAERLRLMTEQGRASLLLTREGLLPPVLSEGSACHFLERLDDVLEQECPEAPDGACSGENAAYLLFTSGSTGIPKGVIMEHRSLVNLLSWQGRQFPDGAAATTLQFAPLSFDVSFQEIFSTLCFGGTLVMLEEDKRRDPKLLLQLLSENGVERVFAPFVALQQLAEAAAQESVDLKTLKDIITAGEQLQSTRSIVEFFAGNPQLRLVNQYGPTETHVVTSFMLGSDATGWPTLPPIGRPVANTDIYILDSFLQPVPIGVTGELYVGGDSVSRGYLHQPDATAERFLPNPHAEESGARIYKTGDLARYLPDGSICILGRNDEQLKFRGFRIEPGEIETVLCEHPDIAACAVSAHADAAGDKRLIAHVVPVAPGRPAVETLRSFLLRKLPEYMIPSAFLVADALPLTRSGKVDRRALPMPDSIRAVRGEGYIEPRSPTESLLAGIWAELLTVERVGIQENFFDLGGHSLLATRVVSRIRTAFGVELALRALFETPTVAGLSAQIDTLRSARNESAAVARAIFRIEGTKSSCDHR